MRRLTRLSANQVRVLWRHLAIILRNHLRRLHLPNFIQVHPNSMISVWSISLVNQSKSSKKEVLVTNYRWLVNLIFGEEDLGLGSVRLRQSIRAVWIEKIVRENIMVPSHYFIRHSFSIFHLNHHPHYRMSHVNMRIWAQMTLRKFTWDCSEWIFECRILGGSPVGGLSPWLSVSSGKWLLSGEWFGSKTPGSFWGGTRSLWRRFLNQFDTWTKLNFIPKPRTGTVRWSGVRTPHDLGQKG